MEEKMNLAELEITENALMALEKNDVVKLALQLSDERKSLEVTLDGLEDELALAKEKIAELQQKQEADLTSLETYKKWYFDLASKHDIALAMILHTIK
jgi:hypothetical protein